MSRAPYSLPSARWGAKMGDVSAIDMMVGALSCPFGTGHMGVTAENVAKEHGITREAQDAFAMESQIRAARAIAEGRFASQITPVEIEGRKGKVVIGYAAFANHCGIYSHSGTVAPLLAADYPGWKFSKSGFLFTPDHPLPDELIRRMIALRLGEIPSHG